MRFEALSNARVQVRGTCCQPLLQLCPDIGDLVGQVGELEPAGAPTAWGRRRGLAADSAGSTRSTVPAAVPLDFHSSNPFVLS